MDVWLGTNSFTYVEVPWGQIGGKNTLKKNRYKNENTFLIWYEKKYEMENSKTV